MAKFRKKTDEVEARQVPLAEFVWEVGVEAYADLLGDISKWCSGMVVHSEGQSVPPGIYVESNGKTICAEPGDWIVKTSHEGWKIIPGFIFSTMYEPVAESDGKEDSDV